MCVGKTNYVDTVLILCILTFFIPLRGFSFSLLVLLHKRLVLFAVSIIQPLRIVHSYV